jgi:hypothetical protein
MGDKFSLSQTQTHKVWVSPNPFQFSINMKSRIPNPYLTEFGYPHSASPPNEFGLNICTFFIRKSVKVENYFVLTIISF